MPGSPRSCVHPGSSVGCSLGLGASGHTVNILGVQWRWYSADASAGEGWGASATGPPAAQPAPRPLAAPPHASRLSWSYGVRPSASVGSALLTATWTRRLRPAQAPKQRTGFHWSFSGPSKSRNYCHLLNAAVVTGTCMSLPLLPVPSAVCCLHEQHTRLMTGHLLCDPAGHQMKLETLD